MPSAEASGSRPFFFLSYAHTPRRPDASKDSREWVSKLCGDLSGHILEMTDVQSGEAGFMDRQMLDGINWPVELSYALATCRVFVPLYSQRYFGSPNCGREWSAFSLRMRMHEARHGKSAQAIVPGLWAPVTLDALPPEVQSIQFDPEALGTHYAEEGLSGIIKLQRFRREYDHVVYQLAKRIVQVAKDNPLDPVSLAEFTTLESAFGAAQEIRATTAEPAAMPLPVDQESFSRGARSDQELQAPDRRQASRERPAGAFITPSGGQEDRKAETGRERGRYHRRPDLSDGDEGRIVTFYSYKSGAGRTMAMANVAWILASNGQRVLAVDWDLTAPGLHRYFHPFLGEDTLAAAHGVVDIINEYTNAAARPPRLPSNWYLPYARVLQHVIPLEWDHFPGEGAVDFLSAGQYDRDYSSAYSGINWAEFYDRLNGGPFIDALGADMRRHYDYILIDSSAGLTDTTDICTIQLPDVLVACFTLNGQSIDGAAAVAWHIADRYSDRRIRILPVPMRIEDHEKEKLNVGRAVARAKFSRFPAGLSQEQVAQYWAAVEIPYKPFYAFEETLAVFGDDPASPRSLLAAYERLTQAITKDRITAMPSLAEDVRLACRQLFTRRQPASLTEVFLSYAAEDRPWADWIELTLSRAGALVLSHCVSTGAADEDSVAPDLTSATHIVVLLSSASQRSKAALAVWDAFRITRLSGIPGRVITVLVDEARLVPAFSDLSPVRLAGLGPERGAAALIHALDQPSLQPREPSEAVETGPSWPGHIPAFWSVPNRNARFTGRVALLEGLRDRLLGAGSAAPLAQTLYGLGGVGKTQIALEYAHRFMSDYDLVWWVPAETGEEISSSLATLALRLGVQVSDDVPETAQIALERLRQGAGLAGRWLLIFDNADDLRELGPYLPAGPGHVLITSRNPAWSRQAEPIAVDVFSRQESVDHLIMHVPDLDPAMADRIAHVLGDLPLALEQAGAWLEETGTSAATYIEQLDTQLMRVLDLNRLLDYPAPAMATWNMSLERLQSKSPAAVRLLQVCACCSPGPISMDLLYSDEMIEALLPFDETLAEPMMLGRVIREVTGFALARTDTSSNSIQVHRLVQAVIRSQMSDRERREVQHSVHRILVGARPRNGEAEDSKTWDRYNMIWPHLMPSQAAECEDERTRQLLIDWVRYLWLRGELDAGLNLASQIATLWAGTLGENHRQTLYLRFHAANLMRSQGRFDEARDLDTDVLSRQRETLGADHPHTLMTAGSLAADLRALGEFREALTRDQETYNLFREQFGDDNPRTLALANNLAVSLRLVGDCFEARRIDRETLDRRRRVLGLNHPYTLFSSANLALDMRAAGQYRESAELLQSTYGRYCELLGDDLIPSLRTAKSLAVSLRKAGDQAAAKRLTEETYQLYLSRYGGENPDALSCALNLACDYSATGDKEQARELVTNVHTAYHRLLGPGHPYTLVAASNLVVCLRGTGAVERALGLGSDTLRAMNGRLGDDHPYALSCAINLANCLADAHRLDSAVELLRRTSLTLARKLGARHPDTMVCDANLAITLRECGQEYEAVELRERVLNDFRQVLGDAHPATANLREWRRGDCDLEPQPS